MSLLKNIVTLIICLSLTHSAYSMKTPSLKQAMKKLSLEQFSEETETPLTPKTYDKQLCEAICLSIKSHEPFELRLIQNLSKESVNVVFKCAAEFNNPATVQFILKRKALYQQIIDYSTYATSNALWHAAQHGLVNIVNMILMHEQIRKQLFSDNQKFGAYVAQHTFLLAASKPQQSNTFLQEKLPIYFCENPQTIQQQKIETLQLLLKNPVITSHLTAEFIQKVIIEATESGYNDVAAFLDKLNCPLL
jgi:hypothetical protein